MRAVAYRRVSSEEQVDGFSLDAQDKAIRAYCAEHGLELVGDYCDPGFSARTDERPAFKRMVADAKRGQFDAIVVHRLDRFSRNRMHFATYRHLLAQCGVQLVSVSEPTGEGAADQFISGILECAAEFYSMRLAEETRKGKRARAEAGYWNGDPPIGYCRGLCSDCQDPNGPGYCPQVGNEDHSNGRVLIPHPVDANAVRQAFELYATGQVSHRDVADVLNQQGYRTNRKHTIKPNPKRPGGPGPFSKDTLSDMLRNEFYLGYVKYKGRLIEGQHEAIVTPELFERVQRARQLNRCSPRNQSHKTRVYPLSGILYCQQCGRPYHGAYSKGNDCRYYRDSGVLQGVSDCAPSYIRAEDVEQQVSNFVQAITLPDDWQAQLQAYYSGQKSAQEIERQRQLLDLRQERLVNLYTAGMLSDEAMQQEAEEINRARARLDPQIVQRSEEVAPILQDFALVWAEATPTERKQMLRLMFQRVELQEGLLAAIQPQADFYPLIARTGATGIAPQVAILEP